MRYPHMAPAMATVLQVLALWVGGLITVVTCENKGKGH